MPKKAKTPQPKQQRPKGPGGEQPTRKRPKRDTRQAAAASELAGPTAQRCGRDGCPVCKPQPCNKCSVCKASSKPTAGKCTTAKQMREKSCPNKEKPRSDDGIDDDDDGRDPRHHDPSSALHKASSDMIALADNPSKASLSQLEAMGALKDELEGRGAEVSKWKFLLSKVERLEKVWSVDDIISSDANLDLLEVATRFRYRGNPGGLPTETEHDEMGPLEIAVVKRWMGHKSPWDYVKKEVAAKTFLAAKSDESWEFFTSYILGGTKDAKRKGETWTEFWMRWSGYFSGEMKKASYVGHAQRFRGQLFRIKTESPQWASTPKAIAWLEERDCIDEFLPRRQEATDTELRWQGCYFTDKGEKPDKRERWRVCETDGVFFDRGCELSLGRRGCLVVAHYNVDIHGDEEPDDEGDVAVMRLEEFASLFEDGGGAKWE